MNNSERKIILTSLKTTLSMCEVSRDTIMEANKLLSSVFSEQPTYNDREKELKKLIYLKSEIIKECKRDIKKYHEEINQINGYKKLEK